MVTKGGVFPPQKLPLSKKDKEWRETSLEGIISRYYFNNERRANMKISYDLINSVFDMNDLKYVTDPYKVGEGFPAKIQNINIIRPKIELLKGEETKRPESFVVFRTDEAAVDEVISAQKDMLFQAMSTAMSANLNSQNDEDLQYLQQRLQQIKAYISQDYYDAAEQTANKTLKYLREKLNIREEFMKGWEDALVAGEEIYYVGIINGEPVLERVNPIFFAYDKDPDLRWIEEGEWATRQFLMTPSAVYDRFFDIMEEADLDALLKDISSNYTSSKSTGANINTNYITYKNIDNVSPYDDSRFFTDPYRKGPFVRVFHGTWRSYKRIGYLEYQDQDGTMTTTIVDETYKVQPGETISWDWITEWWEGYRIGDDIYVGIQPIQYQATSIDNPNSGKGCYVGGAYSHNNSENKSFVEIMKPLQYMYIVLWYRLELALSRDKGKVLLMDITQIPKGMGIDEYKWMHYLTSMGVIFVNPYEEGFNIPGREGGKPASFNQFNSVDLSMSSTIGEYINLMAKIEQMLGELCGISAQRQGQISQDALVGVTQQAIIQDSHVTEPLFWKHNQIKKNCITQLLNTAKFAWRVHDKKNVNYVLGGPEREFIKITDDFLYADYDVFVSDSTKEHQDIEAMKNLYQPAMQNGATLLDIATMMTSTNLSEMKMKLADIEKKRGQTQQQQQEAEQQIQQQQIATQQEHNRVLEEDSIRKSETAITVALITAHGREGAPDQVDENTYTEQLNLDQEKIKLQQQQLQHTMDLNNRKQTEVERTNKAKEAISKASKTQSTTNKKK